MELSIFKRTKQLPIRLRVINFLKSWIKRDLQGIKEGNALEPLKEFINNTISKTMPNASKELLSLIDEKEKRKSRNIVLSQKAPMPHIPKNLKTELSLNDIHPEEIARQLTLIEHGLFAKIQPKECLKQRWVKGDKKASPNIHQMIERFNQVSLWVSTEIVQVEDLKMRAIVLSRFIFIAQYCLELNSYNAVMEILSALNCSAIHRLRQTWDLLPPKSLEIFENLTKLMDGEGNFAQYREVLRQSVPPVCPYLGLILTDLVFLDDGNPDVVPDTNLINFSKMILIANVIKEMQQKASSPYCLEKLDFLQSYLLERPFIDNQQDLYEISLKREERVKKRRLRPQSNVFNSVGSNAASASVVSEKDE